ncbi:MAG TPA: ABC transporter permease [Longimicrobiales bacterium]|nr:ABC transporter permease [Longimicrobiales bacterium]
MNLFDGIRLAFQQIRAQKLKSFFAILGVFIGAMFLVTVVSVITGLNSYMEEDFARRVYGLNTVSVRQRPSVQLNPSAVLHREWARRPAITVADAEAIRDGLDVPAIVSLESYGRGSVEGGDGRLVENVMLAAASASYFDIREVDLAMGRVFTPTEERLGLPVVVLGSAVAEEIFGTRDPVGRTVRVRGRPFEVIGVLSKQGSLFGMSLDSRAIAPLTSPLGRLLRPHGQLSEVGVRAPDAPTLAAAMAQVEAIMRQRHRLGPGQPNDFELETASDSLSFWNRISQVLLIAFPLLVGIALLVGSMVIMNIMLISVVERTREIGIRKAVGARRRDIVLQVLVESATLSVLGALLGIAFGQGLAHLVRATTPLPAALAPGWMAAAAALGVVVGVAAGLYPASRAAALDPVVALRAE